MKLIAAALVVNAASAFTTPPLTFAVGKKAPAKKAPVKKAPVKKAPAKKAPKAPAKTVSKVSRLDEHCANEDLIFVSNRNSLE